MIMLLIMKMIMLPSALCNRLVVLRYPAEVMLVLQRYVWRYCFSAYSVLVPHDYREAIHTAEKTAIS